MNEPDLFKKMLLIRRFEERVLELFSEGVLSGTTHTCIGQEAIPVVIAEHLQPKDIVWSNHRGHGHYLARTWDIKGLLAEMMGLPEGVCGGRGGSQHLCNGNFYSNGVLGSTAPIAAGMALAEKERKSGAIVVIFLGDGAFGEGVVYETLNLAALWKLPVLFVVEDNGYAQTTPTEIARSGNIKDRMESFGIECGLAVYEDDLSIIDYLVEWAILSIEKTGKPYCLASTTYRLAPHSKGDDFRPGEEIDYWKKNNPLDLLRLRLSDNDVSRIEAEVKLELETAENEVRRVNQPIPA